MAISYRCDRCGGESERPLVVVSVGVTEDYSDRTAAKKEVCQRCAEELAAQVDRFADRK